MPRENHYFVAWNDAKIDQSLPQADFMEIDDWTFKSSLGKRYRYFDYDVCILASTQEVEPAVMALEVLRLAGNWHVRDFMRQKWGGEVTALSLTTHGVYRGRRQLMSMTDLDRVVTAKMRTSRKAVGK